MQCLLGNAPLVLECKYKKRSIAMKKKLISILLVVCLLISVCALFACNGDEETPSTPTPTLDTFVSLDINPSIEMTVDSDNKVVSVYGANDDGKVLLYEETGIVGEDLEVAIEKIISLAVQMGYLDEENHVVSTNVVSTNNDIVSELNAKVNAKITGTASGLGLNVTTDAEGAFTTLCEMEELKAKFPNNQAIQNMTISKFKLAMSATENGAIDIETAIAMNDAALIESVKSAHAEIENYATEEYKRAEEEANIVYQKAVEFAKDMVYVEFFSEKFISNPFANASSVYFGSLYCLYTLPAKGFELMAKASQCVKDYKDETLSEDAVQRVMNALGMEESEIDSLKNEEGNITINSVEKYVNVYFKNSSVGVELEEIKTEVKQVLSDVKGEVKEAVSVFQEKYKEEVEAVIEIAESYVTMVEGFIATLPESIKTEVNRYVTDFNDIIVGVKTAIDDGLTIEELNGYAESLKLKASTIREDMLAKLTDADKSEIAARQEQAVAELTKDRQEFEQSIESAKQSAKNKIADIKARRLQPAQ